MSVVVRTKDRPTLLVEALASVAAQAGPAREVVVVNDGGAAVAGVVGQFAGDLTVHAVELHPGHGRCAAGNAGLAAARGRFVLFLDDDDLLVPGALAALTQAAAEDAVVYGRVDAYLYPATGPAPRPQRPHKVFATPYDPDALLFENFIPLIAALMPRQALVDAGGLDESLECFEDWDLFLRLGDRLSFRYVDTPVAEYRMFGDAFVLGRGGQTLQHRGRAAIYAKHRHRYTPDAVSRMLFYAKTVLVAEERDRELAPLRERLAGLERERELLTARLEGTQAERRALESRLAELAGTLVSVIIPNYNGRHHLERCLPALHRTAGVATEVILVDNGSSDGSLEWLAEHHPDVRVLPLGRNCGFGEANRRGVAAARGTHVAFLNSDTEVEPCWLEPLLRVLSAEPDVAAACSTLRLLGRPELVNARGGGMTKLGYGFDHDFLFPWHDGDSSGRARDVLFPTAAAMLMRRDEFFNLGGFDPAFFMYHEDVDLGWRLWLLGRRVVVCPDSIVGHAFLGTSKRAKGLKWRACLGLRHDVRSLLKHFEIPNLLRAAKGLLRFLAREGAWDQLLHAAGWNLLHLPSTLRERARIQRRRTRSDAELYRLGLISASPLPAPAPEIPLLAARPDAGGFLVSDALRTGEHSALGRLGAGWYPAEDVGGHLARWTCGSARCLLRVGPSAGGVLTAEVLLPAAASARREVTLACGGRHETVVAEGGWQEVSLSAQAGPDGLLDCTISSTRHVPHLDRANWDFRTLGCAVRSVRFASMPPRPPAAARLLSVVIPTYNRWAILERTLDALAAQSCRELEVVVVDDGSEDETSERLPDWAASHPDLRLTALHQDNAGQGQARNLALRHASGDIVLFLGDDIIPAPGCVAAHLAMHRRLGSDHAVLGHIDWDRDAMRVTPFLDYVGLDGAQFAFAHVRDGEAVPFTNFYTSNVSVPRAALGDEPFHDAFRTYGWEDIELGWRLSRRGLRVVYHREAAAHHLHPTTMLSFCRRQRHVGSTIVSLLRVCPELEGNAWLPPPRPPKRWYLTRLVFPAVLPLLAALDRLGVPMPWRVYRELVNWAYFVGRSRAEPA